MVKFTCITYNPIKAGSFEELVNNFLVEEGIKREDIISVDSQVVSKEYVALAYYMITYDKKEDGV